MARCRHEWRPMRGSDREKCSLCGTTFPCALECGHVDCRLVKGQPMPDGIRLIPEEEYAVDNEQKR